MNLSRYLGIGAILVGLSFAAAPGCSSDDNSNTGGSGGATGGAGGSTGGSGGATGGSGGSTGGSGGGTGGAGGGTAFMPVAPCNSESDYMTVTEITALPTLKYSPACVKLTKGAALKFTMSFAAHPLAPSAMRGDMTGNPIKETTTGDSASFTFDKSGFFAFFCKFHGASDDGKNMAGVVWVP